MVRDPVEKACPLCGAPRPPRARRCVCNYVFEYERPSRPSLPAQKPGRQQASSILALAIFAAGLALASVRVLGNTKGHGKEALLLIPIGAFCLAGGYFNWSFFMRNSRARRVSFFFGRSGARYFYALLGGAMLGGGAGLLIG